MRWGGLWLWLAPVCGFAALLALVDESGPRTKDAFPPGSVYDEGPAGLSLARRVVEKERSGGRSAAGTSVLTGRIGVDPVPPNGVILRIRPIHGPLLPRTEQIEPLDEEKEDGKKDGSKDGESEPQSRKEREEREERKSAERQRERERRLGSRLLTVDEEAWVRGGGRLVLGLSAEYGPIEPAGRGVGQDVRKVFPAWPGVRSLVPDRDSRGVFGKPLREAKTLFVRGDVPLVSILALGRGDVVVLGAPEMLANASLGKADHAALLLALVGEGRSVLFDERAHGYGRDDNLLSLMLEFGLGPALVATAAGLLLALWRGRVRLGSPQAEALDRRSEAVDLVDSLGELYDRALSRRDALALHLQGLRRAVTSRTGLRGEALDKRMETLAGGAAAALEAAGEMTPAAFARTLATVNDGYRRLEEHVVPR